MGRLALSHDIIEHSDRKLRRAPLLYKLTIVLRSCHASLKPPAPSAAATCLLCLVSALQAHVHNITQRTVLRSELLGYVIFNLTRKANAVKPHIRLLFIVGNRGYIVASFPGRFLRGREKTAWAVGTTVRACVGYSVKSQ